MFKSVLSYLFLASFLFACIQMESRDGEQVSLTTDSIPSENNLKETFEAVSILGTKLFPPSIESERIRQKRERQLQKAEDDFKVNPDSLEYIVWYGRRLSYLYRYRESIQVYTEGLRKFPESYRLFRHRGHRYLTTRQFDKAIDDLEKAAFYVRNIPATMEVDGLPNRRNIPRTSIQFNIWYHLGLAYYLKGNYDKSISAYKKCLVISDNDDMLVAATDWLYMTYRKIGNVEAANSLLTPIKRRMNIVENFPYHNRLLMYKGERSPEALFDINKENESDIELLTQGYGVGNWYYYNGETDKAIAVFEKMMESSFWQAFGYLAAEVELANYRSLDAS